VSSSLIIYLNPSKNALDNIFVIQRLLLNGGGFLLAVSCGTLQSG
jgi:hypothetical protein